MKACLLSIFRSCVFFVALVLLSACNNLLGTPLSNASFTSSDDGWSVVKIDGSYSHSELRVAEFLVYRAALSMKTAGHDMFQIVGLPGIRTDLFNDPSKKGKPVAQKFSGQAKYRAIKASEVTPKIEREVYRTDEILEQLAYLSFDQGNIPSLTLPGTKKEVTERGEIVVQLQDEDPNTDIRTHKQALVEVAKLTKSLGKRHFLVLFMYKWDSGRIWVQARPLSEESAVTNGKYVIVFNADDVLEENKHLSNRDRS